MSSKEAYKKLSKHLSTWVYGLSESEFLLPMLELWFTPEEAELLSETPFLLFLPEQLSKKVGIPLDELTKRGIVHLLRIDIPVFSI